MADKKRVYLDDDYDGYNYFEDNDIYSSSSKRESSRGSAHARSDYPQWRGRKKKKKSASGCFVACFLVIIAVVAAVAVGFNLLTSRANYEKVDTESYVDQSAEVVDLPNVENIMIIGADINPEDGTTGRSDTMLLLSIDNVNKKFRIISFMRDIYLDIPTVGYERLNATFSYGGAALTMQTIENYFGVEINKYVQVDFNSFTDIIDRMGGIDVEIADYESEWINNGGFLAHEGMNHLNGEQALFFARMRYLDSDFARTGRQRQVLIAIMDKFKSCSTTQKTSMFYEYLPLVTHNFSNGEILSHLPILANLSDYDVETMCVPAAETYELVEREIAGVPGNEVLEIDLDENKRRLRDFISGNN